MGTPYYIAPEVLRESKCSHKMDIWAVGVMTYILLSGRPPFNGDNEKEITKRVRTGRISFKNKPFDTISDKAKHFILSLLKVEIDERPTALEALEHPWM